MVGRCPLQPLRVDRLHRKPCEASSLRKGMYMMGVELAGAR